MLNFLIPAGTVKVPLELNVWVPPGQEVQEEHPQEYQFF